MRLVQRKGKYNEKYKVIIKTISKKMYLSHEEMVINWKKKLRKSKSLYKESKNWNVKYIQIE